MILLSNPLKNDHGNLIFFSKLRQSTKIVNLQSLKKVCRQLLSTMNVLKQEQRGRGRKQQCCTKNIAPKILHQKYCTKNIAPKILHQNIAQYDPSHRVVHLE